VKRDTNISRATYSAWRTGKMSKKSGRVWTRHGLNLLRRVYNQCAYGTPNPPKARSAFAFKVTEVKVAGWDTVVKMAALCEKDFPNVVQRSKRKTAEMWALLTLDKVMTKRGIK
jgi:hypothetical protein